ncbi:transcriptional regulator [Ilumatobacter sp.]|uniref:transcriptional regulator n=1 Tax=Ilumatobacter sp. TaxID=1967498 RepID=UPI003B5220A6
MTLPTVLMSVRSPHVERLLSGEKTVELRRRRWRVPDGSSVLLYGSRKERAIVGSLVVKATTDGSPTAIWNAHGRASGLTRSEFRRYFDGAENAVAIEVCDVRSLEDPLTLDELRRRNPRFHVPQSYRFVPPDELAIVLNGERAQLLP